MPSEQQYVELGKLVRNARNGFKVSQAAHSEALGQAIVLTETMLLPGAEQFVYERLGRGLCEVEDLFSQAAAQIIEKLASWTAITGKEFYNLMRRMVEGFVHDLERRRRAFRRRNGADMLSLERDTQAARLAELLADEQPSAEALAILAELKHHVRRAIKHFTHDERFVVRKIMQGIPLAQVIEEFGPRMRAAWRSARRHLRERLAPADPHTSGGAD